MKVTVLEEHGHTSALLGMGLSHGVTSGVERLLITHKIEERLWARAKSLAHMQGGHNKFLESIQVWIDVSAPIDWWIHKDTYRMATKQSTSEMHRKKGVYYSVEEFEHKPEHRDALQVVIDMVNAAIAKGDFELARRITPKSFIYRRIVCLSYKTLQNIYNQRKEHKMPEWHTFCDAILEQLQCPQWIKKEAENG